MNEKIAPKTILAKTALPAHLCLVATPEIARYWQEQHRLRMVDDIDDLLTGGHRRAARQAEHAIQLAEAQRLEREAQAVFDDMVAGAGAVYAIVKTIEHDRDSEDQVLAVFFTEDAAKAALAKLSGMSDLSISEFPLVAP